MPKTTMDKVLDVVEKRVAGYVLLQILDDLKEVPGDKGFRAKVEQMDVRARTRRAERPPNFAPL